MSTIAAIIVFMRNRVRAGTGHMSCFWGLGAIAKDRRRRRLHLRRLCHAFAIFISLYKYCLLALLLSSLIDRAHFISSSFSAAAPMAVLKFFQRKRRMRAHAQMYIIIIIRHTRASHRKR